MLSGRSDPHRLEAGAPRLASFDTEALSFEGVESLQVLAEVGAAEVESLLPPALHPTIPGVAGWLVQRFPTSPWGEMHLAQMRLRCRSGVRPRDLLLAAYCDNDRAAEALRDRWGYRVAEGVLHFRRSYDEVRVEVAVQDESVLELALRDPVPLGADYVQYVANLNPAMTPDGLRLVQVEPELEVVRAERGHAVVDGFEGRAWNAGSLAPEYAISASFTVATMTIPALRFVCRPDVWAFEGTEVVTAGKPRSSGEE
jgi:hypothetical protein